MRIAPDGGSNFNGKYHQEEAKELEGKEGMGEKIPVNQSKKSRSKSKGIWNEEE